MRRSGVVAGILLVLLVALAGWWFLGQPPVSEDVRGAGTSPTSEAPDRAAEAAREGPELRGLERVPASAAAPRVETVPEGEGVAVTGRVVDERRRPVAGIDVELPEQGARGRTDEAGRFRVRVRRAPHGALLRVPVVARRAPDRVASALAVVFPEGPDVVDAGVLELVEGSTVEVAVRAQGSAVAGARVALLGMSHPAAGCVLEQGTTDRAGRALLRASPAGPCRLVAHAAGHGRAWLALDLPRAAAGVVTVELPAARSVDLTVVWAGDEAPVVGAAISLLEPIGGPGWRTSPRPYLWPIEVPLTDAAGRTRIEGLGPEDVLQVEVRGDGVPMWDGQGTDQNQPPHVAAGAKEARVVVPRLRTIRWPVTEEHGPRPPPGEVLTVRPSEGAVRAQLPGTARMEGQELVMDGVGPGHVHAYAMGPGRTIARLFAIATELGGRPTSFRPMRHVEVEVLEEDGTPVTGLAVVLRNVGNNPTGDPTPLDAQGRARIEGLHSGLYQASLCHPNEPWTGLGIGSVNLDAADGRLAIRVASKRRATLRVTLDGASALPARYWLNGHRTLVEDVEEDAERGEIRFGWRPPTAGPGAVVACTALGYLPADEAPTPFGTGVTLELAGSGAEPDVLTAAFVRGLTLHVDVLPPADGRARVVLERLEPRTGAWAVHQGQDVGPPNPGPKGRMTKSPLPPGRYRAVEADLGVRSAEAELVRGQPAPTVVLDLSRVGFVRGRVEVPEGFSLADARVRVIGGRARRASPLDPPGVHRVSSANGTFGVRVSGEDDLTFEAQHPLLVPAPDGGRVAVREPREGLVLRLVPGAIARLTLDAPTGTAVRSPSGEPGRVVLVTAGDGPATLQELAATIEGDVLRFGGFAAGTYSIWVDLAPHALIALGERSLGAGETDLGRAQLERGASLVVDLRASEGQAPPRVTVTASRVASPAYVRTAHSRGEARVVLSGLAPGRHQVRVMTQPAGAYVLDEEVVIEADQTVERTVDVK